MLVFIMVKTDRRSSALILYCCTGLKTCSNILFDLKFTFEMFHWFHWMMI